MDGFTFTSNILTFISNVIASLAWPAVAIFLIYLLRSHLGDLAERLRELTLPGTKAVFAEKLDQAREKLEEIEVKGDVSKPVIEEADENLSDDEKYLRLARDYPEAAILYAFKEVEETLLEYHDLFPKAKKRNLNSIVTGLLNVGVISDSIVGMFHAVQDTRNTAVHAKAGAISTGSAIEYRRLCKILASELRDAISKLPQITRMMAQSLKKESIKEPDMMSPSN